MRLNIIIIGDEILLGRVTDTNSGLIARTFAPSGWETGSVRTVGDDREAIARAVADALDDADLVVTTGGLGPTRDDITKGVLTDCFGGELRFDSAVMENVEAIFRERGIAMNKLTGTQAMVPSSCRVIQNRFGTAPVMWFEKDGKVLVAMPGVPFETRGMLPEVAAQVQAHFHPVQRFHRTEFTLTGISESALAEQLAAYEDSLPEGCHLAYLPSPGIIVLRLDAADMDAADFGRYKDALSERIQDYLAGEGTLDPAGIVLASLRRRGLTLATAESCTGGNIARLITSVAGCSDVFRGSVVSYCNEVKSSVLGVPDSILESVGAVSEQTVRAMAEGVRRVCDADCAVATSGIAGPGGAVPGKPVGTVWIAASTPEGTTARLFHIGGDRKAVVDGASARALLLLDSVLKS